MIPVCAASALSALQTLFEGELAPGSLDEAMPEIMEQVKRELDRILDTSKQENELEENRPKQVPEAKKTKGPEMLFLMSQNVTPQLAIDAIWKLHRKCTDEPEET